ncbi:MAG: hypothetical protein ACRDLM_06160 [Gaiellaceae bacterium]
MGRLVWRGEGEFGFLGAEVVESRLQADESIFAAFGGELALLEGLVVALQRLLGARDLSADGGESMLERRATLLRVSVRARERVADDLLVAVERGELVDDCLLDLLAGEAFAVARFWPVLLAS